MRAFVEVDLKAITKNVKWVARGTNAEVLAVVKADAYGHGLVPIAKTALKAGATWLGVALLEEAFVLRKNKIKAPIIAWLTPPGEDFKSAIANDIQLSVPSIKHLKLIEAAGKKAKRRPQVHIEIDTGMSRGGLLEEWSEFLKAIVKADVDVIGFWSHFARADEPGHSFNKKQEILFNKRLLELMSAGIIPKYVHFSNSAATLTNSAVHNQIVRLGISMYGLSPDVNSMGSSSDLGLVPAMCVKAEIHLVKDVKKDSPVGYGGIEVTKKDTKLAIISMGYSDGIPRQTSNKAGVFIGGKRAPIIGRVSMDQFVVDLGKDSKAKAGDIAVVMGGKGFSIDEWAKAAGTINYEIVTRIATRVPRIYL